MTTLELVAVEKSYGSTRALADYSLQVPAGRVTAFVGANGAGKSTAMRLLGGLRTPDRGDVLLSGRALDTGDRGRIGHMPEERGLYPDEPLRTQLHYFATLIGIPSRRTRSHVEEILERIGVAEIADRAFGALSLGNRQRAQLALAVLGSPDFLLLDEPFSGLDVEGLRQVSDLVRSLASDGVGILVSSHQLEVVAAISERVAVISDGRAGVEGELSDVLSATARFLRLMFRHEGLSTADVQAFVARSGGRPRRRAGALIVEVALPAGHDIDGDLVAAAAAAGPLASVEVVQPSLRDILEADR